MFCFNISFDNFKTSNIGLNSKYPFLSSGRGPSKITNEAIKAIDIGCPNVNELGLHLFSKIEFESERIVFCKACGWHGIYHLKNQSTCPNTQKILEARNKNKVMIKDSSKNNVNINYFRRHF